ncbi:RNA polymerase sigma factor [Actinophytocola algeriensis]|uniref:RNA polymerase sigma factor (Sigma-70 family) n=1 Tax=Actinophytocola algeriensis TaxID=1768010 RepID=A0A7W7QA07_9PSEU|nr:sigma-70 family RNA polymerase sigma factor [Actinophytocola algeriensis]MBB4909744.1 RNA polymerase sigma factor (sigma-70 family) [Actinophytocola algeriensis]MBE1475734.1 RNA polymerase sigma factor (sigma-70 family) [Actinophytocola algeriensis]
MSERTDTELVAGVLAGDREAFAAVYDRYANRLHDFCWSVLRDRDEAADAVQDTFVLAVERLVQLNDPERLRPWLYAIARSVALRRVRVRGRVVLDEVEDMADTDPGPHRAAEQQALADLVWSAAAGLSERDRALLDLHLRQGLDGAELGEAMGVSANHAYVLLTRLRDQVERSLGALLIARLGRRDCTELDTLLADWDGRFSPLMRKRVARHVDACEVCSERRRVAVSPLALLAGVPLLPAPLFLKDRVMAEVQLVSSDRTVVTPMAPRPPKSRRGRVVAAGVAVLALLAAGSVVAYWRSGEPLEGEPLALENTVPSTTTSGDRTTTTTAASTAPTTTTTTTPITTTTTTTRRTTTTTTNVAQPPPVPPDPPEPPEPPRDTTQPVVGSAAAGGDIYVIQCGQPTTTSITASATDNVGVTTMMLRWTDPAGVPGSTAMQFIRGAWRATLGPFSNSGDVPWTVTASDAEGNTGSRSGETAVYCPVIG